MDQVNPQQTRSLSVVPDSVSSTIAESYVCEFSVLRRDGTPVTLPMGNYPDAEDNPQVCVGLTFPWTSELARRTPKVCISYCRPTHPTLPRPPLVVVSGHAAVRDADLQANTDHYAEVLTERFPEMFGSIPAPLLRWMSFYLARIWIHVTPVRISWWPEGDITGSPQRWEAPQDQDLPQSDPPPQGPPSRIPSRFPAPKDWRRGLDDALDRLGPPVLTVVDDGYPVTFPALEAAGVSEGVVLGISPTAPAPPTGRACLTFHTFEYDGGFASQKNRKFIGSVEPIAEGTLFRVERELVSGSLPNKRSMLKAMYKVWRMRGRLAVEAARRGQLVPRVRA